MPREHPLEILPLGNVEARDGAVGVTRHYYAHGVAYRIGQAGADESYGSIYVTAAQLAVIHAMVEADYSGMRESQLMSVKLDAANVELNSARKIHEYAKRGLKPR